MPIQQSEEIIAGGADDYLEARHVILKGTNREIGRAIGDIGRSVFDSRPLGSANPIRAEATRRYIHEHYPIHEQRILGAADAYGVAEGDATFIGLPYLLPPMPGCSVAFVPPNKTAVGPSPFLTTATSTNRVAQPERLVDSGTSNFPNCLPSLS